MDQILIRHLFISAGHNYFGHHGGPAGQSPIIALPEIECVAGRGVRGDRFFDYEQDYKGQITFFSLEVFRDLCHFLGAEKALPGSLRRNVITEGIDLNSLVGAQFEIQGLRFEGVSECKPCYWMDQAIAPGAEHFLKGRGGLRARIRTNGKLRIAGD
jgi:MOSC domain-containing protein YiiM